MNALNLKTMSTIGILALTPVAHAGTYSTSFESPDFTTGSVNSQDGWSATNPNFDQQVVSGVAHSGSQSWHLTNQFASGSFGDQPLSAPLSDGDKAGESAALGATHRYHEFSVWFRAGDTTAADGSFVNISATDAPGSRINYIGIGNVEDAGLHVETYGVAAGNFGEAVDFPNYMLVQGLDRNAWHQLTVQTTFVDGPGNDLIDIYVDGNLVAWDLVSWEDYYRNDPEQAINNNQLFGVDRVGFYSRTADDNAAGFYFDDFTQFSAVPEPASLALLGIGGGMMLLRRRVRG